MAAPLPAQRRTVAILALREAWSRDGASAVKSLRDRYKDLPERTWWRWVALAKDPTYSPTTARQLRMPRTGEALRSHADRPAEYPAPEPANSASFIEGLDLIGRLETLYREACLLSDYALAKRQNGETVVTDPAALAQAIALKSKLLESEYKAIGLLINADAVERFQKAIVGTLRATDRGLALKAIAALRATTRHITKDWPRV